MRGLMLIRCYAAHGDPEEVRSEHVDSEADSDAPLRAQAGAGVACSQCKDVGLRAARIAAVMVEIGAHGFEQAMALGCLLIAGGALKKGDKMEALAAGLTPVMLAVVCAVTRNLHYAVTKSLELDAVIEGAGIVLSLAKGEMANHITQLQKRLTDLADVVGDDKLYATAVTTVFLVSCAVVGVLRARAAWESRQRHLDSPAPARLRTPPDTPPSLRRRSSRVPTHRSVITGSLHAPRPRSRVSTLSGETDAGSRVDEMLDDAAAVVGSSSLIPTTPTPRGAAPETPHPMS